MKEARQRLGPEETQRALAETLRIRWVDSEMSRWGVETARPWEFNGNCVEILSNSLKTH